MKKIFEDIKNWFEKYSGEIIGACPEDKKYMLHLKLEHSKKVSVVAECLAKEMSWNAEDTAAAEILGLLHDTGRFYQFSTYGTFNDALSLNHGELGFRVVDESGILNGLKSKHRQAILDGIHYHNGREIPRGLTEFSEKFVKLIRDADKLDIYRVISDTVKNKSLADRLKKAMKLDPDGPVSESAVKDILQKKTVSNENLKSLPDFYLMLLSWIFDFNYRESVKKISAGKFYEEFIALLPGAEKTGFAAETVMARMNSILAE